MDKDTGYGAENKALIGVFVYWAILGEEVLDGGDAEGHIRTQAQPTPNGDLLAYGQLAGQAPVLGGGGVDGMIRSDA